MDTFQGMNPKANAAWYVLKKTQCFFMLLSIALVRTNMIELLAKETLSQSMLQQLRRFLFLLNFRTELGFG